MISNVGKTLASVNELRSLPDKLIHTCLLYTSAAQRFGGNAQQAAQLPRELFEADAKRRVQVGLLFSEVIKSCLLYTSFPKCG